MFNVTRHGQTASAWMSPGKQKRQAPLLQFANVVAEEYGTNDLSADGSGTPSTILTNLEGIWATARAAGVQKVVRTLLMPRTSSTSQWSNLADQIPNTGWGPGEKRDTINAALLAARDAGKVDVIVDTLAVLADPTDSSRWLSNGTNKYVTEDGTHVSPKGNELLAPHLRAALLSLTVDDDRPDYSAWSEGVNWDGADSSPGADPNGDGVNNLLAYALALPPLAPISPGALPIAALETPIEGESWLTLTYRQNATAMDLIHTVESSADLVTWSSVTSDGINAITETVAEDVDGDGKATLRRLKLKQGSGEASRFLRLRIRY
jgi:lysophospholipase L1-like esterase